MFSFLGRGIFYIFIGSVIVGDRWFRIVPGAIVGIVGLGYAVLEYIPSIEPPANMRSVTHGLKRRYFVKLIVKTVMPMLAGVLNKSKPTICKCMQTLEDFCSTIFRFTVQVSKKGRMAQGRCSWHLS